MFGQAHCCKSQCTNRNYVGNTTVSVEHQQVWDKRIEYPPGLRGILSAAVVREEGQLNPLLQTDSWMFCALEGILFLPGNFPGYIHAPSPFCSQSSEEQLERKLPRAHCSSTAYRSSQWPGSLAVRKGNLSVLLPKVLCRARVKNLVLM